MNRLLLVVIFVFGISNMNSQEKEKFRMGLDLGYAFASEGGGALFNIEPKYNITDNSNVGIRIGAAARVGGLESDLDLDANVSFLGTYDYYFNKEGSSIAPFLGGGLGVYVLGGSDSKVVDEAFGGNQFGAMVRGGVELGKFRAALEYNILPKSNLLIGQSINNSYVGLSLGFYFGGGRWKN